MKSLVHKLKVRLNLSDKVVETLLKYDRQKFHPHKNISAYYNRPKVIPGTQQTMSAPHIHAMALQAMEPFLNKALLRVKGDYKKLKYRYKS